MLLSFLIDRTLLKNRLLSYNPIILAIILVVELTEHVFEEASEHFVIGLLFKGQVPHVLHVLLKRYWLALAEFFHRGSLLFDEHAGGPPL